MATPYQLIGQFLREHPDVFCVDCLAEAINASPSQVSMATQRLLAGEAAFAAHRLAQRHIEDGRISP